MHECLTTAEVDAALDELVGTFIDPANHRDRVSLSIPRTLYTALQAIALEKHQPVVGVVIDFLTVCARAHMRKSCYEQLRRNSPSPAFQPATASAGPPVSPEHKPDTA
jgi:hypothetical protein